MSIVLILLIDLAGIGAITYFGGRASYTPEGETEAPHEEGSYHSLGDSYLEEPPVSIHSTPKG